MLGFVRPLLRRLISQARPIARARSISQAPLAVALGALSRVGLGALSSLDLRTLS
jgi:hypothetical protein